VPINNYAKLGALLVQQEYLSQQQWDECVKEAKEQKVEVDKILTRHNLLTPELLEAMTMAEKHQLPFYDLERHPPAAKIVSLLPEDFARSYGVVVVAQEGDDVTVAVSDPSVPGLQRDVALNLGKDAMLGAQPGDGKAEPAAASSAPMISAEHVSLVYASKTAIHAAFSLYHKSLATRLSTIFSVPNRNAPEMLGEIIDEAMAIRTSDIHLEPREKEVLIRFRVDGVMHRAGQISRLSYEEILNRIKIEANLRIDEHYAAQDGAIRYKLKEGGTMDIRVSIVPIVDGEKVVMRLLSEYVRNLTLGDLGFSDTHSRTLQALVHKPFGMIITTGPTGAGKSTTLYGLIKMRNHPEVNISTIEDPVEYKIDGINHIQVNQATGLTFVKGLRALLRQDPDVILIGEVRDSETANIAVSAALTGHLVFSTLHSNDSPTAIPRLLEMGVEPFLLASTVEVIIAQRLVRKICPSCRFSYALPPREAAQLFTGAEYYFADQQQVTLYRGKGCSVCNNTGFSGRIGIYELLVVDKKIQELIIARANSNDILLQARLGGMLTMFEDGLEKGKAGLTTLEELLRVASPPDHIPRP